MSKNIIVVGYPKSGNTWMARLLGELLNCPVKGFWGEPQNADPAIDGLDRPSDFTIWKSHHTATQLKKFTSKIDKIICIVRDPRDIAVSGAHFFKFPKSNSFHAHDISNAYAEMSNTIAKGGIQPWCHLAWSDHITGHLKENDKKYFVKYEDLIENGHGELRKIADFLGIEISDSTIQNSLKEHSFENSSLKASVNEDRRMQKIIRKGKTGEYRTCLTGEQQLKIEQSSLEAMAIFGYELNATPKVKSQSGGAKDNKKNSRWLLCRPQGGLNDILCQIEKCCRYAELTNRSVIVDTAYTKSDFFKDSFDRYFSSKQNKLILSYDDYSTNMEKLSINPEHLNGRLNLYEAQMNETVNAFCDIETGQPTTFDFKQDHPHPLLVHHQAGGGILSQYALLRLTLNKSVVDELSMRIQKMGGSWLGVHVRNTDYQTNYEPLLQRLKERPFKRIFLATDSLKVREHFQSELTGTTIHSFSSRLSTNENSLQKMHGMDSSDIFNTNTDAILDLMMLALSTKLIIQKLKPNSLGTTYSGYSVLANNLWTNKIILQYLISDPRIKFGLH